MTADQTARHRSPWYRRFSLRSLGTALAVAGALGVALALPAQADSSSGNEITRYDVAVDLASDGTMGVVLDFDFDFGDDPGHGPYLTVPSSQRYDDDYDRIFAFSDITATSDDPSAAPADLETTEENGWLQLRIGDPDVDNVSGVHRYTVTYTTARTRRTRATSCTGMCSATSGRSR